MKAFKFLMIENLKIHFIFMFCNSKFHFLREKKAVGECQL
jgi:hypothetical protein